MGKKVGPIRVVIDTNVLVSALLFGGQPGKLRDLWVGGRLVPLVSKQTFAEFNKVLAYPKFRLSTAEIAMLVEEEVLPYAVVVNVTEDAAGTCRDSHDDKFLALAVSGHASYLVTGDQDLLVLQAFGNVRIVSVSDFLALLGQFSPNQYLPNHLDLGQRLLQPLHSVIGYWCAPKPQMP